MVALKAMCEQSSLQFLCARYENMDFLISKNQFVTDFLLENERRIKSAVRYLASITRLEGKALPIFDFDMYLKTVFGARPVTRQSICLLSKVRNMSDGCRESLYGLNLKSGKEHEKLELIGIKLTGNCENLVIEKNEMKILPPLLHEVQNKRGILGLRFVDHGKIEYVLDIEIIIINSITNHRSKFPPQGHSNMKIDSADCP